MKVKELIAILNTVERQECEVTVKGFDSKLFIHSISTHYKNGKSKSVSIDCDLLRPKDES